MQADLAAGGSSIAHLAELDRNPLCNLTPEEKQLVWQHRNEPFFRNKPRMLSKVLSSVPSWMDQSIVEQAYSLIDPRNPDRWVLLGPGEALQLLDNLFWETSVLMKGQVAAKGSDLCCIQFLDFAFKMMNFVFKLMNLILQTSRGEESRKEMQKSYEIIPPFQGVCRTVPGAVFDAKFDEFYTKNDDCLLTK